MPCSALTLNTISRCIWLLSLRPLQDGVDGAHAFSNLRCNFALREAIGLERGDTIFKRVGPDSDPLRMAALAVSFLNRTVRPALKSSAGGDFAEIAAYPRDRSAAFVCTEGRCSLPVTRPEEIAERVALIR